MDDARPRQLIGTIERAADILTLLARSDQGDLGVTEIATELKLSKAVVHRVLTTLVAKGLAASDATSHRYRLGPTVLALGVAYIDRLDIRNLAMPRLRELSSRTNETATLSLRYGWERMYIDQVTPDQEVKMTVALGRAFPLHAGSSSKAFLAFISREEQERYLTDHRLERLTASTLVDVDTLRQELNRIRERGYAVSFGERQAGAGSVAAPVLDYRGQPAAVVSVCGPLERFREGIDDVGALLLTTTTELSHQLGHPSAHKT